MTVGPNSDHQYKIDKNKEKILEPEDSQELNFNNKNEFNFNLKNYNLLIK